MPPPRRSRRANRANVTRLRKWCERDGVARTWQKFTIMVSLDAERPKQPEQPLITGNASHTAEEIPPPFEQSAGDPVILDFSQYETYAAPGGEDPPEFTPYDADCFVSGAGHVVSHDPHLNEDGEALYRFLLSQAASPPQFFLHCYGSHDETRTHLVRSDRGERSEWRTEYYTEKVIDFDFKIDVGQHILGSPTHWSVADSAPAYRGRMFHEVGIGQEKRKAKSTEIKAVKAWDNQRDSKGFPPWISSDYAWREDQPRVMHDNNVLKSSWTLRQWADDYCFSRKFLKEFEYYKVVYGWDFDALISATRSVIASTYYRGDIKVSFETSGSKISIRSDNRLSRALSNGWIKFLLIITFIYPFLWLFRRFHHRGGGVWKVCGGAYALKRMERVTTPKEHASIGKNPESTFADARPADMICGQTSGSGDVSGLQTQAVGLREGVWFRQWEGNIRRAVLGRLQDSDPLVTPDSNDGHVLDGY